MSDFNDIGISRQLDMISLQHGVLHRKQTLAAGGEYCDYYITGHKE